MRISLKYKLFLPLLFCALVFGAGGYYVINGKLLELRDAFVQQMAGAVAHEVATSVELLSQQAYEMSLLFTRLPEVLQAYELAHGGNIDDEQSPHSQQGRVLLRETLQSVMQGYEQGTGSKLQLHFHLPNGRSLVRMWREKNERRDGQWEDISDDISAFRPTVMEVNRTGQPRKGIELGSGGFAIRGVAPIKSAAGKQLGSVEILTEFKPVLDALEEEGKVQVALYMDAQYLNITTRLRDPEKFPLKEGAFVLVVPSKDQGLHERIALDFLNGSMQGARSTILGDQVILGSPVLDFQGKPIGVIVQVRDIKAENAMIATLAGSNAWVLLLVLGLSMLIGTLVFVFKVQRPTMAIVQKIKDIAEDRADLKEQLPVKSNDEIGELSLWFNRLTTKLDSLICTSRMYMNMVNAVPEAMFAVDNDMRITVVNDIVPKMFGRTREEILGTRCSDLFRTEICGTDDCPIGCSMRSHTRHQAEVIPLQVGGETRYLRPMSDAMYDCDGKRIGYFEVATDVTDMVKGRQQLEQTMERMGEVAREVHQASEAMAEASEDVAAMVTQARRGADQQGDRVASTAAAMEEMNATILEVARSAGEAATQGDSAMQQARKGMEVVGQAVQAIAKVADLSRELKQDMGALGTRVDAIGRIMDVIQDIADQTNLLALNAAIEAARAGEAGRGFAVVADEVRKLAEKTMGATKEVGQAIHAIQDGASRNIQGMEQAAKAVEQATSLAGESGEVLRQIVSLVEGTVGQVQAIAAASEQQSATSEEINRSMEQINAISGETARGMTAIAGSLENLERLAARLKDLARG